MEEWKLNIDEKGNVSADRELTEQERNSKLHEIMDMIRDESTSPGKIKRVIAEEIASVSLLMIKYSNDVNIIEGMKVKVYAEQVKALRELGKEVMEADTLSHKDFLNMDGKKFKYAVEQYAIGLKEAMKLVKLDDTTINSILNHWRDIMSAKEEEIRREIDKLDSKK